MTDDPDEAVTVAVAARQLGCDPSTIRKLLKRRRLRGHRIGLGDSPRGIRVSVASLEAWKRRHAIGGQAEPETPLAPRRQSVTAAERALDTELRALGVDVGDKPRRKPTREVLEMRRQLRELGVLQLRS